jgi:hypothetical protein
MPMKTCRACNESKPLNEFYERAAKCKPCTRAAVLRNRLEKLDYYRSYDRQRAKLPHRVENAVRVTRNWRRKHKDRSSAQGKAERAHMKAPTACEGCKRENVMLSKHHPDYSRPLLVMWLCKPCHVIADKVRRTMEAAS